MKKLLGLVLFWGIISASSQSIKIEFAGTGVKPDYGSGISGIFNNTIYTHSASGNKVTITGFDANTLKQTIQFKGENTSGFFGGEGLLYLENSVVVLHEQKRERSEIYGNIYAYDGKLLSEDKLLHKFVTLNKDGHRSSYSSKDIVSQNGKFFALFSYFKPGEFEYVLYDQQIKLQGKGIVKFPKEYSDSRVFELTLSNTGNIGILANDEGEKCSFNILRLKKGEKVAELVKTLSSAYKPHMDKVIATASAIYIGGVYGNQQIVKDMESFSGKTTENSVYGAFGIKLDQDKLDIVYDHLTAFTPEQVKAYNTEFEKFYRFKAIAETHNYSKERMYNFNSMLRMDGMSIDKDDHIATALSSYDSRTNGNVFIETSMNICQFKLTSSGSITNYKVVPKRQQTYGSNGNSSCFLSSLVCSSDNVVSLFNDDEDNLDNLTDMEKNVTKGNKKAWLVGAETKSSGSVKKIALLPENNDVLILPRNFMFINDRLSYALGLKDNGEIMILKINS
jgi:hypothetical protein